MLKRRCAIFPTDKPAGGLTRRHCVIGGVHPISLSFVQSKMSTFRQSQDPQHETLARRQSTWACKSSIAAGGFSRPPIMQTFDSNIEEVSARDSSDSDSHISNSASDSSEIAGGFRRPPVMQTFHSIIEDRTRKLS
eukprot:CAMPEP_0176152400 /NCGR_PEP_ID=MMETSP0120_2-20121206/77837_1 /TAXON_ID=160619 /ORGANISM="Kryptoperidinium foliaceum, Strain CCMP 1326" /LENGTH=135 /DNA_ID=CAMNT_0017489407 /DNA_START=48 /DNA_END=452 /DNA_ORIENTATION=+